MYAQFLPSKKWLVSLLAVTAMVTSCKEEKLDPFSANIQSLINSLDYDPDKLLNVQAIGNEPSKRTETGTQNGSSSRSGGYIISCGQKNFSLQANADQIMILRDVRGNVWPGALVKGNATLLDGSPDTIQIDRAPMRLQLDLPSMGDQGNISIAFPSDSAVQSGIAAALDWWNANAYQEGYANPSYLSYKTASSYSAQQAALDLGLNTSWASSAITAQLNVPSSSSKKVALMCVRQGFYTVSMPTPSNAAAVFGQGENIVSVEESTARINAVLSPEAPPAYIQSVMYGRLLLFRLETTLAVTPTDVEVALQYAAGTNTVTGEMETRVKSILSNGALTMIKIGPNGTATAQGIIARTFGALSPYVNDKTALYTKENPGTPISYDVKFLKDNRTARMGYSTTYKVEECSKSLVAGAPVSVANNTGEGAKVGWDIQYTVSFKDKDNADQSLTSGTIKKGQSKSVALPAGAYSVSIEVQYKDGTKWKKLGSQNWDIPTKACFEGYGNWELLGKKEPALRAVTCN